MASNPTLTRARAELARRIENWLELPMAALGAVWLLLMVLDLLRGPTPVTDTIGITIWIVFILEFALRLIVAPARTRFLRRNWVTLLSLALPALRVFRFARVVRILRAGRATRTLRLARLLTSFNRGMRALGSTMQNRGFSYVVALTLIVLLLGAAGLFTFERERNDAAFATFGSSLWWTAMLLTTMGSEFWPRSSEGRLICLLLSVYASAVFGYITATLASYFVESDAAGERARSQRLERELAAIRAALQQIGSRE